MNAVPNATSAPYAAGMTAEVVIHLPRYEAWTWDDLQAIPDEEHHHYELIEGQVLVSPSPDLRHQTCVLNLAVLLRAVAPAELQVVVSPFDFVPEPHTTLQPDVLVIRRGTSEEKRTVVPPVLVVEVLSPRTMTTDRTTKRELYARFGVQHYWIVDPAEPSILALELGDEGAYVEAATIAGESTFTASAPFAVELTPSELVDD